MPDDIQETQIAEQVTDADFQGGFDENESGAPAPAANDDATDKEDGAAANPPAAGDEAPTPAPPAPAGKDGAAPQPDQQTAQQKLEERASSAGGQPPPAPPQPAAPAPPPAKPADTAPAQSAGNEWISKLLESPDVASIKIGDGTTIKDFAAEYPEAVQAPVAIAKVLIDKMSTDLSGKFQAMQAAINGFAFWDGVQQAHADARKVIKSPEFTGWVGKQSPVVQKMLASDDVEDAVSVLDAFKESLAKANKDDKSAEAAKRKAARDALHGETLRGTRGSAESAHGNNDKDDFDAGFYAKP